MGNIKRKHLPAFKAKIALELLKETDTVSAICSRYAIHPTQAGMWKERALSGLELLFSAAPDLEAKRKDELIEELYKQIGQLKVELDWLKKKTGAV
jgi:transposase-like protein